MIMALLWTGVFCLVLAWVTVTVIGFVMAVIEIVSGGCFETARDLTPDEENMVREISHTLEVMSDG